MSDDDDVILVKRSKQPHYGSLEEQEKARLAALAAAAKEGVEDTGGKDLGDIQVSNEDMDLEDEISKNEKAFLEEFEHRRKLNDSTDDDEVHRSLWQLGEPVCLYRAGPAVPRVRLRDLLNYLGEDAVHEMLEEEEARIERDRGREGTWCHEGPSRNSREARLGIAKYSPSGKPARPKERRNKAPAKLQLASSIRATCKNPMMQSAFLLLVLFVSGVLGTQSGLREFQQRDATCACNCDACYNHTRLFFGLMSGECDLPNSLERNRIVSQLKKENLTILCYDDLDIPTNEARLFKYVIYSSIFLIGVAVEFIRSHFRQYMRKLGKMVMCDGLITRVQSFLSSIQTCRRTRHRSGNGSSREGTPLVDVITDTWDDESTPTGRSQRPLPTSSTTEAGTSAGPNTLRRRRPTNDLKVISCRLTRVEPSEPVGSNRELERPGPIIYRMAKMGADVGSNISLDLLDDQLAKCVNLCRYYDLQPVADDLFRVAKYNNKMLLSRLKSRYHPSTSARPQETGVNYWGVIFYDNKQVKFPIDDIALIEKTRANADWQMKRIEETVCYELKYESTQSSSLEDSTSANADIGLAISQTPTDTIYQYYRNIIIDLLYADVAFIGPMAEILGLHRFNIDKALHRKYSRMAYICRAAIHNCVA